MVRQAVDDRIIDGFARKSTECIRVEPEKAKIFGGILTTGRIPLSIIRLNRVSSESMTSALMPGLAIDSVNALY